MLATGHATGVSSVHSDIKCQSLVLVCTTYKLGLKHLFLELCGLFLVNEFLILLVCIELFTDRRWILKVMWKFKTSLYKNAAPKPSKRDVSNLNVNAAGILKLLFNATVGG